MKVELVNMPDSSRIAKRPLPTPLWDSEWFVDGVDEIEFFTRGVFEPFRHIPELKGRSDTNIEVRDGNLRLVPLHNQFLAERVVLYPAGKPTADLIEFREQAVVELRFSDVRFCDIPLRDVMPLVTDAGQPEGSFDPSEAPDLRYRRGLDLRIEAKDYCGKIEAHPLHIETHECLRVLVRGDRPATSRFALRCYLVGTYLKPIQG